MFTQEQLDIIKYAARNRKNQGELSVYTFATSPFLGQDAITEHLDVLKYCAEECKRQRSGEMSVYDMVNAWDYAMKDEDGLLEENTLHLTLEFISRLGQIIEPHKNKVYKNSTSLFRTVAVGISDGWTWIEKASWERVPDLLSLLLESYYEGILEPTHPRAQTKEDQLYYEFENIHPFRDGNGRVGKVIFSYTTGSLDNPYLPPNFWDSSNP